MLRVDFTREARIMLAVACVRMERCVALDVAYVF